MCQCISVITAGGTSREATGKLRKLKCQKKQCYYWWGKRREQLYSSCEMGGLGRQTINFNVPSLQNIHLLLTFNVFSISFFLIAASWWCKIQFSHPKACSLPWIMHMVEGTHTHMIFLCFWESWPFKPVSLFVQNVLKAHIKTFSDAI